jgi:hypothetical protein
MAKYISIHHSGIKLLNIFSDQKTYNTIEFVASNYPKNDYLHASIQLWHSQALEKSCLSFRLLSAINSLCYILKSMPNCTVERPPPCPWEDSDFKKKVGWTNQQSPLAQWWWMLLLRHWIGGSPGVEPVGLPIWVIVITYIYIYIYIYIWFGTLPSLE